MFPNRNAAGIVAVVVLGYLCAALAPFRGNAAHMPYGDGPPAAHTGGFGEPNCRACHWENPLNTGGAALRLSGLPEAYTPGVPYALTIELRHDSMRVAGFQLSSRYSEGELRGKQAGELRSLDTLSRAALHDSNGVVYAQHTRTGTRIANAGVASWQVRWVAPAAGGTVTFHIAANAGDDNNSASGDYVYVIEKRLSRAAGR